MVLWPDNPTIHLKKSFKMVSTVVLVGAFALSVAGLFTTVRWNLYYHGLGFARLSTHPFDLSTESGLRYRILTPLLGYLTFLKGPLLKYLTLCILGVFLGLCYHYSRRQQFSHSESLGITLTLAFTTLVSYQLYFPGYNDSLSYLLILLFLNYYNRPMHAGLILMLLLFNHDNNIFLFPFFFLLMTGRSLSIRKAGQSILVIAIAGIPYFIYRLIIGKLVPVDFDTNYYFTSVNLFWTWDHVKYFLGMGIFQAFRLFWVYPVLAVLIFIFRKQWHETLLFLVCFLFVLSQMIIAFDISRLVGLAFPLLLLSFPVVKNKFGEKTFRRLLWSVFVLNLLVPSYCVGALEPIPLPPFWFRWIFPL
ncbi:MAG: hypothetical protein IT242_04595 [Bacteroidia bacterium]|nr:hypothetical protein [Bacteroidia bacterium]